MKSMKEQALKSLQKMGSIWLEKLLADRLMSQSTANQIMNPIGGMDWLQKKIVADELVTILETSKTEEEILRRAEEMYNNFTGGKEI